MAERPFYSNIGTQRTSDMLTVDSLKSRYLSNVKLADYQGNLIVDEILQDYINIAVSMLEAYLDIYIYPVDILEEKDYRSNDYWQWGFMLLNNIPVIEVTNLIAVYPNSEILEYPAVWLKLQPHDGTIRIIPTAGTLAQFQVDAGGQYFPEIFRYEGAVPLVWQVSYQAGFLPGKIPFSINHAVGLLASIIVLDNLGSGVINPGFASTSLSIDGLSQNLNTTMSTEGHAYSGLIKSYQATLFGDQNKQKYNSGLIGQLKNTFHGAFHHIL